jgi:hypothetical protein
MSQHDFNIANQLTPNHRADLNKALVALATNSSGSTEPTTTYANMFWYDSSASTLKIRDEADSNWISLGYVDQSTGQFSIFDDTAVVNASGVQQHTIGDQTTATWEGGTATSESLVSPSKVWAAITSFTGDRVYTSSETSYADGNNTYTFTHGLGDLPTHITVYAVCKTSEGGYSVGDHVALNTTGADVRNDLGYRGVFVAVTATDIDVEVGQNIILKTRGSQSITALTPANWRLLVKASL